MNHLTKLNDENAFSSIFMSFFVELVARRNDEMLPTICGTDGLRCESMVSKSDGLMRFLPRFFFLSFSACLLDPSLAIPIFGDLSSRVSMSARCPRPSYQSHVFILCYAQMHTGSLVFVISEVGIVIYL